MAKKEWCSYSPASGTGPQDISFTPDKNTGRESRTLQFTCSLGSKAATCTVNQAGAALSVRITGQPPVSAAVGDAVSFKVMTNAAKLRVTYMKDDGGAVNPLYPATFTFPDTAMPSGNRTVQTDVAGSVTFINDLGAEEEFEVTVAFDITAAMAEGTSTIVLTATANDGASGNANASANSILVTAPETTLSWRDGEMEFEPDGEAQTNRILTNNEEDEWNIS